jgi:hypothetical protein
MAIQVSVDKPHAARQSPRISGKKINPAAQFSA